jgi:hypothetical protein
MDLDLPRNTELEVIEVNHDLIIMEDFASESVDLSVEEEHLGGYKKLIGRQVGVKFDGRVDPGIITTYNRATKCFSIDFDDDLEGEYPYDDIKISELIFLD